MKIKQFTGAIFLMLLCSNFAVAQTTKAKTFNHSLDGIEWVEIYSSSTVIVQGEARKDLEIKTDQGINTPDKAKGLKAVYGGGDDNTGVAFNITKNGKTLIVTNLKNGYNSHGNRHAHAGETNEDHEHDDDHPSKDIEISLPASINVTIKSTGLGSLDIKGFTGEIEANAGSVGHLWIEKVAGPITASSTTGDITVVFDTVNQSSPISITSTTADIDVSLPSSTPANIEMSATMGGIYTDFDLKVPDASKNNMQRLSGGQIIKSNINNGGVPIILRNTTGDIYLRKQ
jgi:DUF4097 and DUF4098 domain-containing protein YvlB